MTNILEAIFNIAMHQNFQIGSVSIGNNRVNSIGEALEGYIKDAFAGTLGINNESEKLFYYSQVFSWSGNQNNPPDIMIKGGDAIEVKKIQGKNNDIALNSSYPKVNIRSDSPMIAPACRDCEQWAVKDLIYCVGYTFDKAVCSLWFVYGTIYAAQHETYQKIKTTISEGISAIPDVEFAETRELGRVNRVDPLGITNLRIRGMWHIQNPRKVFSYLYQSSGKEFELICIIPTEKFITFADESLTKIKNLTIEGFSITDVHVKNPNNPADLIACKLIKLCV